MHHDWRTISVADIASNEKYSLCGGPFGSKLGRKDYVPEGIPVIRGSNLSTDGTFSFEDFVFVSEQKADELIANTAYPGDLVFTQRGTLGQVGLIPTESKFSRFIVSQSQMKLTVDIAKMNPYFVFLYFRLPITIKAIKNRSITSGVPHINLEIFSKLQVPHPPLEVQEQIVRIISAYDDLIDNNNRRIALLEEAIHRLYREWFVHLRFPGHEQTPIVAGVPEGWEKRPLGEVCELTMGQSPKSEFYNTTGEGLPFHQGVKDFGTRFVTHTTWCTQPKRIAKLGDILFSVRAPVGRINVASDKLIIGRGLAAIRNRRNFQSFQLYQLKTKFFKEDMIGGGAIFASVTKKQLSQQLLIVPSDRVLEDFERIAAPVDQQIANLSMQNLKLAEARDALLPRLMNGSLAV